MRPVTHSLRHAARRLLHVPTFSLAVVLTLALGIGATTAVFSVVNAVLLRPLPYADPDRLVWLSHTLVISGLSQADQSDATYLFYRRHNTSFAHVGAYQATAVNLGANLGAGAAGHGEAERVPAARVTAEVFPALGVRPLRGRLFAEQDDQPHSAPVVLLGERLWARKYGATSSLLGGRIEIDGVPHDVVGIMPASFGFPASDTAVWVPMRFDPAKTESAQFDYQAVARLRDGVSAEAAAADLQALLPRVPDEFPGRMTAASIAQVHLRPVVRPLAEVVVGDVGRLLWVALAAVGFVLAIACANVANLFLVRAEGRQRALAIQRALGASQGDILLEFFVEGFLVAALGGTLGVAAAAGGVQVLQSLGGAVDIPRLDEVDIDVVVLAIAAASSLLAALFVSGFASLRLGTGSVASVLTGTSRSATAGRDRHRARQTLVALQVALAVVLLVGSGLMARSVWRLRSVPPGFNPEHGFSFRLALPTATYAGADETVRFFVRALDDIAAIPGVQAAGAVSKLPLDELGRTDTGLWVEDRPLAAGELPGVHPVSYVTPGFFRAAGIPFVSGRTFDRPDPPNVLFEAVVSRAFAERYWGDESPVGKRVRIITAGPWYTVVGVVESVRGTALWEPADQMVYFPVMPPAADPRWTPRDLAVVVRTAGDPVAVTGAVRDVVGRLDASLPIYRVRRLSDVVARASARASFTLLLLACASVVALVLGAIGLYGVMAYVVSLRTREMGIRLALGARPRDVGRMVSRQALAMTAVGLTVGLAGALVLTRFLAALLFEVSPTDPAVLVAASVLLLAVAMVASWLPARRAAGVDPVLALHTE